MHIDREPKPRKYTGLRIGLATAVGLLGSAGTVTIGKTILDETSKQKVVASEQQPDATQIPQLIPVPATEISTPFPTAKPTETPAATKPIDISDKPDEEIGLDQAVTDYSLLAQVDPKVAGAILCIWKATADSVETKSSDEERTWILQTAQTGSERYKPTIRKLFLEAVKYAAYFPERVTTYMKKYYPDYQCDYSGVKQPVVPPCDDYRCVPQH